MNPVVESWLKNDLVRFLGKKEGYIRVSRRVSLLSLSDFVLNYKLIKSNQCFCMPIFVLVLGSKGVPHY